MRPVPIRSLLILINFAFLLIGLYSLYERRHKYRLLNYDPEFHWLALTLVLGTSILQALLIFADNWRFSVPYQALIIYVVIIWLWLFGLRRQRRRARATSSVESDQAQSEEMGEHGAAGENLRIDEQSFNHEQRGDKKEPLEPPP